MEDRYLTTAEIKNLMIEAAAEIGDGSINITRVEETSSGEFIRAYLKVGTYLTTLNKFAERSGLANILIQPVTESPLIAGELHLFFRRPSIEDAR